MLIHSRDIADISNRERVEAYQQKLARIARRTVHHPEAFEQPLGEELTIDKLTSGVNEDTIGEWWLRQARTVMQFPQRVSRGHALQTRRFR